MGILLFTHLLTMFTLLWLSVTTAVMIYKTVFKLIAVRPWSGSTGNVIYALSVIHLFSLVICECYITIECLSPVLLTVHGTFILENK